jgi:protein-disulfide isomerase
MIRMKFFLPFLLLATAAWSAERLEVPIGDAPVRGPADAPVTIVEFIDFQ